MNKNRISNVDIKVLQFLSWFIAGFTILIILIPLIFVLVFNFSFGAFFILFIGLFFILGTQYFNSKVWNIWYEEDKLYFENIYKMNRRNIDLFKCVEKSGILDFYNILHLNNGESYYFMIKPTYNFSFFYSDDRQTYLDKINQQVKNYIRLQKGHTLFD